jgi:hypothetical protein
MTWEDRLELWLKEDVPTGPGRSPQIPLARRDWTEVPTEPDTIPIDCRPVAKKREV